MGHRGHLSGGCKQQILVDSLWHRFSLRRYIIPAAMSLPTFVSRIELPGLTGPYGTLSEKHHGGRIWGQKAVWSQGPPNLWGRDDQLVTTIRTAPAGRPEDGPSTPEWLERKASRPWSIILEPRGLVNYKGIIRLPPPSSLIWNKNAYFMLVTLLHFEST